MRSVGFQGTSRSLKSLRDETIFINKLIATIQYKYSSEAAVSIFYRIFGQYHSTLRSTELPLITSKQSHLTIILFV